MGQRDPTKGEHETTNQHAREVLDALAAAEEVRKQAEWRYKAGEIDEDTYQALYKRW